MSFMGNIPCPGLDKGVCPMADKPTEPPEYRRKQILRYIQTSEHDGVTITEVTENIDDDVNRKTVDRNLDWMELNGVLKSRTVGNSTVWWVNTEKLSAEDSVVTARQVGNLLKDLYRHRWEFRLMAIGVGIILWRLSLSFWIAISFIIGIEIKPIATVLLTILLGLLLAEIIVLGGLFIFPVETLGSWPLASGRDGNRRE